MKYWRELNELNASVRWSLYAPYVVEVVSAVVEVKGSLKMPHGISPIMDSLWYT